MTNNTFKYAALIIAWMAPISTCSADGIGSFTGTSTPQVITPHTTEAPQTPAYPEPPIGTNSAIFVGRQRHAHHVHVPRTVIPAQPHG
jgi:hypothetical protein